MSAPIVRVLPSEPRSFSFPSSFSFSLVFPSWRWCAPTPRRRDQAWFCEKTPSAEWARVFSVPSGPSEREEHRPQFGINKPQDKLEQIYFELNSQWRLTKTIFDWNVDEHVHGHPDRALPPSLPLTPSPCSYLHWLSGLFSNTPPSKTIFYFHSHPHSSSLQTVHLLSFCSELCII